MKLNLVKAAHRRPLPQIYEVLDDMRGSSLFTTIELFRGYWQIKIEEICKDEAIFICHHGNR